MAIRDGVANTSAVREEVVKRLVALLAPLANEEIPQGEFLPSVGEPHGAECMQRFVTESDGLEELATVSQEAGMDVGLEVIFENGSCSHQGSARNRVEEWIRERRPALGCRSPNDILVNGDETEHEHLLGLIAGIECGVHS